MARSGANSAGSSQQGGQYQHPHQPAAATQIPETIDDAPPPFESLNDDNHQETAPGGGGPKAAAFPPESSQSNNASQPSQFPPQNTQTRSAVGGSNHGQAQAFPPAADHQHQPQDFPPTQGKPQAFPPSQHDQPQAFPPPPQQGTPQAFPPPQGEQPQAFPPPPQAFPPQGQQAQSFPPQPEIHSFPPQQEPYHQNIPQYQPAPNFSTPGTNPGYGQNPMPQSMPNQPFVRPNPPVINTPLQGFPIAQPLPTNPWLANDFFGCMEDPTNAIITACFPCVTFGQIAEIIDNGQTSCATSGMLYGCIACLIGMPCLISCTYRTKLRGRYGLMESPAPDWLIHCLCEPCALCQEYRELQKRGIDPSIGWQGNLARNQQMVQMGSMTPPMKQNMMA